MNIWEELKDFYGNITKTADTLKIDRTYMWYRNKDGHFKNPPKPITLKRIVDNSNGILNYLDMMWTCGYLSEKDINYSISEDSVLQNVKDKINAKRITKTRALTVLKEFVTFGDLDNPEFDKTKLLPAVKKILEDYK